jgi:hypothetical protein
MIPPGGQSLYSAPQQALGWLEFKGNFGETPAPFRNPPDGLGLENWADLLTSR